MHYPDNQGWFEKEPSLFPTGMVLRMPAHLAMIWLYT